MNTPTLIAFIAISFGYVLYDKATTQHGMGIYVFVGSQIVLAIILMAQEATIKKLKKELENHEQK